MKGEIQKMKKYVVGFLIGVMVSASAVGFADGMMGKSVDAVFPLKIDGNQASNDAVSIEGTSYVPVRAAGEMFGYDVNFSDNTISLVKKGPQKPTNYWINANGKLLSNDKISVDTVNNEFYVPLSAVNMLFPPNKGGKVDWDGTKATISIPGKDPITIYRNQPYQAGIQGFEGNDEILVSLSAIGFTGIIDHDTLYLK